MTEIITMILKEKSSKQRTNTFLYEVEKVFKS